MGVQRALRSISFVAIVSLLGGPSGCSSDESGIDLDARPDKGGSDAGVDVGTNGYGSARQRRK